jgi:hypothetical protein
MAADPAAVYTALGETSPPATSEGQPARQCVRDAFLDEFVFCPDQEPPPEQYILDGFLYQGVLVVWIGREKHRKTNLLLQLAICAAAGRPFLSFSFAPAEPLRVVFVDYESKTRKLKGRYEAICRALNLTDEEKHLLKANLRIIEVPRVYSKGKEFPRFSVGPNEDAKGHAFWKGFAASNPAGLYIFDPMRSLHAQDENDSNIERLLTRLRQFAPDSTVIISHHMKKAGANRFPRPVALKDDMRAWSDGARGSRAIKAHADVIVCQERKIEDETEVVYWGVFQRDEADIAPMPLQESEPGSFFWQVAPEVPKHLQGSFDVLQKAGGKFTDKADAAKALIGAGVKKATAYRHLTDLVHLGLLVKGETGEFNLNDPQQGYP